jgi:hypothetical protein
MSENEYIDYTVPIKKAGLWANIVACLLLVLLVGMYILIWPLEGLSSWEPIVGIVLVLAGMVVHEYVHAVSFWKIGKVSWESITISSQLSKGVLTCHTDKEMKVNAYRVSLLAPFIVLGLIPYIVSIILGIYWLAFFGIFMIAGCTGDFYMVWILRKVNGNDWVKDHPTEMGGKVRKAL